MQSAAVCKLIRFSSVPAYRRRRRESPRLAGPGGANLLIPATIDAGDKYFDYGTDFAFYGFLSPLPDHFMPSNSNDIGLDIPAIGRAGAPVAPPRAPARPRTKSAAGRYRAAGSRSLLIALTGAAIFAGSAALYPYLPRYYEAQALVLLRPTNQDGQPVPDQAQGDALSSSAIETYTDLLSARPLLLTVARQAGAGVGTDARTVLSGTLFGRLLARLHPPHPVSENALIDTLRANLHIHRFRKSYALQVGFTARTPALAVRLTNALLDRFVAEQVAQRVAQQQAYTKALEQRVDTLRRRTTAAEAAVNRYAAKSGLINVGDRDAAQQQLTTLSKALASAQAQALEASEKANMLVSLQKQHAIDSAPAVMDSPVIQAIKKRVILLNGTTRSSHMALLVVRNFDDAIAGEVRHIVKAAQTQAAIDQQQVKSLRAEIDAVNLQLVGWKQAGAHLDDLRNAAAVTRAALKQATTRYLQQEGRTAMIRPNLTIVARAVPPDRPVFPSLKLYAIGTVLLVFLAGAAIAMAGRRPGGGGDR